jgi:hypothetical protein
MNSTHASVNDVIRSLITEGFMNTPKSVSEINAKTLSLGYSYDISSIDSALRKTFIKNEILQRTKNGKKWTYFFHK